MSLQAHPNEAVARPAASFHRREEPEMPATADAPTYLTVQEVAELLRLHPRTVRNWIREGRLKAKKLTASPKGMLVDQRDALGLLADAGPVDVEEDQKALPQ